MKLSDQLEERKQLALAQEAGKQLQLQNKYGAWEDETLFLSDSNTESWRVKPEPLECWANEYPKSEPLFHRTEERAIGLAGPTCVRTAVHMKEVIEDKGQ